MATVGANNQSMTGDLHRLIYDSPGNCTCGRCPYCGRPAPPPRPGWPWPGTYYPYPQVWC